MSERRKKKSRKTLILRDLSYFDCQLSLGFSGERGIRTPGTLRFNGFQDRRNRPLCHLSGCKNKTDFRFRKIRVLNVHPQSGIRTCAQGHMTASGMTGGGKKEPEPDEVKPTPNEKKEPVGASKDGFGPTRKRRQTGIGSVCVIMEPVLTRTHEAPFCIAYFFDYICQVSSL